MRKIFALYQNEIIKMSKKISTLVILIILIGGIVLSGAVLKIAQVSSNTYTNYGDEYYDWYLNDIKYYQSEIDAIRKSIEQSGGHATEDQLKKIEEMNIWIEYDQRQYDYYNNGGRGNSYLSFLIDEIFNLKLNLNESIALPDEEKARIADKINKYESIFNNKDYNALLEMQREEARSITDEFQRDLELSGIDIIEKIDPAGDNYNNYQLRQITNNYKNMKYSLHYNIDYSTGTQTPLTPDDRTSIENSLAVLEYKIDNNLLSLEDSNMISTASADLLVSVGVGVAVFLVLIVAGGIISQEISSGSIKSLIISPTKRWKIFIAKLLALITVGVFAMILTYIVSIATSLILFGTDIINPYIYAVNGTARQMNFFVYQLASVFVNYLDILVYTLFAFMLSTVTRNTAVATGVSIGVYFIGSNATSIMTLIFGNAEWLKFIPFTNMSLAARIFPESGIMSVFNQIGLSGILTSGYPSITFSLIYLAVLVFCLLYITFDSFTRRDI